MVHTIKLHILLCLHINFHMFQTLGYVQRKLLDTFRRNNTTSCQVIMNTFNMV